jgi:hypothetical protein
MWSPGSTHSLPARVSRKNLAQPLSARLETERGVFLGPGRKAQAATA